MIKISDLDLTDAIDQAARKLLGEVDYQAAKPIQLMTYKQQILETVLPVLPSVIKQVEKRTGQRIASAIRGRSPFRPDDAQDANFQAGLEVAATIAERAS